MKVIGSTSGARYLVEATVDELNMIAGSDISEGANSGGYHAKQTIRIGTNFAISKGWELINAYNRRKREIATVRKALEGVLQTLEFVEPIMQEPEEAEAVQPCA